MAFSLSSTESGLPRTPWRTAVALGVAILTAGFVGILYARQAPGTGSDFDQCWIAARALLGGENPWHAVRDAGWPWPLYYPLPATLIAVPFTALPLPWARAVFAGLGAGLLTYGITRRGWWGLAILASAPFLDAIVAVQWTPLLTAAALIPALGWAFTAKPSLGLALWTAYPTRVATLSSAAIVLLSLAVLPAWPRQWLNALAGADHIVAPVFRPGGVLLLLAFLRWRRPEARLLGTLACVPHGVAFYETLPLLLVAGSLRSALGLTLLGHFAWVLSSLLPPAPTMSQGYDARWPILMGLVYLPALVAVLRRTASSEAPGAVVEGAGMSPSAGA